MADKELAEILAARAVDHLRMWGVCEEMKWFDMLRHVDGYCKCTVQRNDVDLRPMSIEAGCNITHTIVVHDFINLAKFFAAVNRIDFEDFRLKLGNKLRNEMSLAFVKRQIYARCSPAVQFFNTLGNEPPREGPRQKAFRKRMLEAYERNKLIVEAEIYVDNNVVREALEKARQETDEPAQKKAKFEKPAEE